MDSKIYEVILQKLIIKLMRIFMPLQKSAVIFSSALTISSCTSVMLNAQKPKSIQLVANGSCLEDTTRQGFTSAITTGDTHCVQESQVCISGKWQGPELFPSCDNFTKSCNGHSHGSSIQGYLQPTSSHGIPCTPATKTCINGNWTGPEVFPNCSEL